MVILYTGYNYSVEEQDLVSVSRKLVNQLLPKEKKNDSQCKKLLNERKLVKVHLKKKNQNDNAEPYL